MKKLIVLLISLTNLPLLAVNFSHYNSALPILVTKTNQKTYVCSSVAISKKKLLTAAHCLDGAVSIKVAKEHKLNRRNTFYKVRSFKQFPLYNKRRSNFLHDIGIIKLTKTLPDTINLPKLKFLEDEANELVRIGFGSRGGVSSRTFISPLNQYENKATHIYSYDFYSYSGDSGGPLFMNEEGELVLVALHSTKEGYYSYNPKIDQAVMDWIKKY